MRFFASTVRSYCPVKILMDDHLLFPTDHHFVGKYTTAIKAVNQNPAQKFTNYRVRRIPHEHAVNMLGAAARPNTICRRSTARAQKMRPSEL